MYLLEDKGEVSLYHDGFNIFCEYQGKTLKLPITWNFNAGNTGRGWKAVSADFLTLPANVGLDYPFEDILLLWENGKEEWQALTFSATNGNFTGQVSVVGDFWSPQKTGELLDSIDWSEPIELHGSSLKRIIADQLYFSQIGFYSGNYQYTDPERIPTILGNLFPDIYYGVAKESSRTYELNQTYELGGIKDFDGNLHANPGSVSDATKNSYKYQGLIDVNADGTKEAIYTNKESGRWVTASINSSREIDYIDYGSGGTTRVVGIYIDPLVTSGEVEQFGPHDSQRRFQNDLKIDNLIAKTSGDYDGDGFQEVYWKTNDGTAYLRALMHADGNIQYANYQSEAQMSEYLTSKGYTDVISELI